MRHLLTLSLLSLGSLAFADDSPAKTAFEKLKKLEGKWVGKATMEGATMDSDSTYKLTGNGTALVETLAPGSTFEMVTVFHMDGDNLILTHYCGAGNQPTMKWKPSTKGPEWIEFDFLRGTNMKNSDSHMHSLSFRWISDDHVEAHWVYFDKGKAVGNIDFDMTRKKD